MPLTPWFYRWIYCPLSIQSLYVLLNLETFEILFQGHKTRKALLALLESCDIRGYVDERKNLINVIGS